MKRSIQVSPQHVDAEWFELIVEAKKAGLSIQEIRAYFRQSSPENQPQSTEVLTNHTGKSCLS